MWDRLQKTATPGTPMLAASGEKGKQLAGPVIGPSLALQFLQQDVDPVVSFHS